MGDVDDFVTRLKMFEEPLDGDYFTDAMDYFREEYDPVAFLYVSNDMKWTRENIPNDKGQLSRGWPRCNEHRTLRYFWVMPVRWNLPII